jgi:hypothetical protein
VQLSALGTSAQQLLAAFVEELQCIDGFTIPPGQYVAAGEVPWDGPGLYLYLGATNTGQPGAPVSTNIVSVKALTSMVGVYVQLIRQASSFGLFTAQYPGPAPDATLNAEGVQAFNDAGALILAATNIKKKKQIVTSSQEGFVIGQITPIGPQGGLAAVRLYLELSIDEL